MGSGASARGYPLGRSSVTILKIPNEHFFNITSIAGKAALVAFLLPIMHPKIVAVFLVFNGVN